MKLRVYTIIILLLTGYMATAREEQSLRKANYLYSHLAYHEAIGYYLQAMPADAVTQSRLGDCYRLTKDPVQANVWYAKATAAPACPPASLLHYAQTLMTTGDYSTALAMLNKYKAGNPNDHRITNMIASCETIDSMKAKVPAGFVSLLGFNTNASEFGPSVRGNDLFFVSDTVIADNGKKDKWTGAAYYNIYSVDNSMTSSFGRPVTMPGKTNSQYHDGPCAFSPDGNTMYFTRTGSTQKFFTSNVLKNTEDVVHLQLMVATDYDEATGKYKTLTPFKYNSADYSVAHATVSKDGSLLLFTSDMSGGQGGTDIYMCSKTAGGWGQPQNVGAMVNTEGNELFPYLDANNTLYFASDGLVGFGGLDLYKASWNARTNTFDVPVNMGMPVNSSYDDISLTFTTDGTVGYFASDRPAAKKGDNIYSFTPHALYLSVVGVDSITKAPVTNYAMTLIGSETNKGRLTAANDGRVFTQLYPGVAYTWQITAPHYQPQQLTIYRNDSARVMDTVFASLKFDPRTYISLNLSVFDEGTDTSVMDAQIQYSKAGQSQKEIATLNAWGQYRARLEPDNTYYFTAVKSNYSGKTKEISTRGIKPESGQVVISESLYLRK